MSARARLLYWCAGCLALALWFGWPRQLPQAAAASVHRNESVTPDASRVKVGARLAGDTVIQAAAAAVPPVSVPAPHLEDPDNLERYIRRRAVLREDGSLRGMRVYPGWDEQPFLDTGVQAGDLITAADGEPLNDIARASEILDRVAGGAGARLTVERTGLQVDFSLPMANQFAGVSRF
jgi:hypothetical protein